MKFDVQSFLYFGFAVTLLMAGNTASGVMKARKDGSYNKQELIDGIYSYILWLVSILCLIAASQIFGGEFEITIGGTTYTLAQAVDITKRGVYLVWAAKLIQNVYEYAGIKRQVDLDKLVENTNKNPVVQDAIIDQEGQG